MDCNLHKLFAFVLVFVHKFTPSILIIINCHRFLFRSLSLIIDHRGAVNWLAGLWLIVIVFCSIFNEAVWFIFVFNEELSFIIHHRNSFMRFTLIRSRHLIIMKNLNRWIMIQIFLLFLFLMLLIFPFVQRHVIYEEFCFSILEY